MTNNPRTIIELQFYPYDFEYRVDDGVTYFYFYGRKRDGQKVAVKHRYAPFFYAAASSVDKKDFEEKINGLIMKSGQDMKSGQEPAKVISFEIVEKELLGRKQELYKIYANYPKAVPLLAKEIQSWGIPCYERDILYVHRYLRDHGIIPMKLVKALGTFVQNQWMRIPVFLAQKIEQQTMVQKSETLSEWRILAIDIETYAAKKEIDFNNNPILMIALFGVKDGGEFRKVLTWKNTVMPEYVEIVPDEGAMLKRMKEIILEYNPDIITGYFTDGFDFPYLQARAGKHKVRLDLGLDHSEIIIHQSGFGETEGKIKGLLHLDMLKFIRNIFGKNLDVETYSLDAVSRVLLGHQKHDVDLDKLSHIWDKEPEKLAEFCAYNLHDSFLAYKLCEKLLPDMIEFTSIVGLPTFDVIRMRFSKLVESYILKRAVEFNVLAPNKPENTEISRRMEESIEGGFVYEPTPGLYKDVVVFDFRSLYPTIICAHNISPEGFKCSCCKDLPHVPGKEEYWFCSHGKKFLPVILEQLIIRRAEIKQQIKEAKKKKEDTSLLDARSYALKILANSFYGYLGFYAARWYCLECAASTTAYARNYIAGTIAKAQQGGFKVIYADTDSCFLLLEGKTIEEAMKFMGGINENLPSQMELEFEGHYPRGIFVSLKGLKGLKGSEKGAKKKYALLKKDGNIKITGFETVRRNWSLLAKEMQEKVLRLILQEKVTEAIQYVKKTIDELRKGEVAADKLILKMQITRDLSSYSSFAPHVKIAREMQQRGQPVRSGTIVQFIIVKGKGLIRDRAKIPADVPPGQYDAEYYVTHQLIPVVSSIFTVLGYSEEELFKESSQTGLGKFF